MNIVLRVTPLWESLGLALCLALLCAAPSLAGPREQAKRLHDRLVGTPPSPEMLAEMELLVASDAPTDPVKPGAIAASYLAMDSPDFYSSALKNFVTPWTNEEQSVFADLNDYSATVIGMIRDEKPFDEVLSADLVYVGADGVVASTYSHTDNEHYRELEAQGVDLSDPTLLVERTQSGLPGSQLLESETAGVITTRAAGAAFFSGGTNRRMWRYTAINYLCRDMEALNDTSRSTDRIRQDISRSPGGDSTIFNNSCSGCHTGMDPLAGAYAYFDWDEEQERVVHSRGQVQPKYLLNDATFPYGYITTDNSWGNYWRAGANAALGWRGTESSGFGAKGMGREIAGSRAFSQCQVEKVFRHVCFRDARSEEDALAIERIMESFENDTPLYSMKRVFAQVAVHCMGE